MTEIQEISSKRSFTDRSADIVLSLSRIKLMISSQENQFGNGVLQKTLKYISPNSPMTLSKHSEDLNQQCPAWILIPFSSSGSMRANIH